MYNKSETATAVADKYSNIEFHKFFLKMNRLLNLINILLISYSFISHVSSSNYFKNYKSKTAVAIANNYSNIEFYEFFLKMNIYFFKTHFKYTLFLLTEIVKWWSVLVS